MSDVYNDDLAIQADFCSSLRSGRPFLRSFEMLQDLSLEPFLNSSLLQVYYVFFVYLLVIVILNGVIIALVTNTYDTVNQNAQNVFWRGRLELVIEIEIWDDLFTFDESWEIVGCSLLSLPLQWITTSFTR